VPQRASGSVLWQIAGLWLGAFTLYAHFQAQIKTDARRRKLTSARGEVWDEC